MHAGRLLDLREGQRCHVIEEQQHTHLVGAYYKLMLRAVLTHDGTKFCLTKVALPRHDSSRMFIHVELSEEILACYEFLW